MPQLEQVFKNKYKELVFTFTTTDKTNDVIADLLKYVSGFLGLISLIALFLSLMCSAVLFRIYVKNRQKSSIIAECFGLKFSYNLLIVVIQLLILSFLAFAISLALGTFLSQLVGKFFLSFIQNLEINLFSFSNAFEVIIIALGSCVFFALPIFFLTKSLKPITLIKENYKLENVDKTSNFKKIIKRIVMYTPALLFFYGIAFYLTDITVASFFTLVLSVVLFIIFIVITLMIYLLDILSNYTKAMTKISLRNITRQKDSTILLFIPIALGIFLITLLPHISNGINKEIQRPNNLISPDFFLIDIQDSQLNSLKNFIKNKNYNINNISPVIRARLVSVNDVKIADMDFSNNKFSNRKRGFNLTYREKLSNSEYIVEGSPLTTKYYDFNLNKEAEISVEHRYAQKNDLKIGDKIVFNIMGFEIKTKIVNLRKVRWNSFQPNFFISVQKGLLEDAPKTYVANINGINSDEKKTLFVKEMANKFSNISAINIEKIVSTIIDIADKAFIVILFFSIITISSGLVVIFSVSIMQAYQRRKELSLLKILGLNKKKLQLYVFSEFFIPSFFAILVGIFLSYFAANMFAYLMFDNLFATDWLQVITIISICILFIIIISIFFALFISKIKPLYYLNS